MKGPGGRRRPDRRRGSPPEAGRTIRWTEKAWADLSSIGEFIARDDAHAAAKWVTRILGMVERAAILPEAARAVPELDRADIREVFLRTYRIVYRVETTGITVLTVFEGHRLFPPDVEP